MQIAVEQTTQIVQEATQAASESGADQSVVILVTGFVVVFMVLLILIGIIKIYSGIVCAAQNKTKTKNTAPKTDVAPIIADPVPDDTSDEGIDLQTIAVISAAVEAYYSKGKKVRITGIRHAQNAQSAWAAAGLYENIPAMRSEGLL